jgi:H+-transporting ATPase
MARANAVSATAPSGLSSKEAAERLAQFGPNAVKEDSTHPVLALLSKFWAPVPWMLEVTLILEFALKKYPEAAIIGALLIFNAALSFIQENRAQHALDLLRQRLSVQARVLRDGRWQLIPARNLVPGDVIHLRMGDLLPADVRLSEGDILMDQSALTGESAPVDGGPSTNAFAAAVVKRGEATGEVTATGQHTYFGKTAELVRTAKTAGHLQEIIFRIVKYLVALDLALVLILMIYALAKGIPLHEILPYALILVVASVPVALPATFTLASALGTQELAARGVMITRLSAIEEAASMNVLACDKTGTITKNQLAVADIRAYPPYCSDDLLKFAALASDEATQDPIDMAVLKATQDRGIAISTSARLDFVPFDPARKRSEAVVRQEQGSLRVIKGAPSVIAGLSKDGTNFDADVKSFAAQGYRALAVAAGSDAELQPVGLVGLLDPPRDDSRALVENLHRLGVKVLMVTGDGGATAQTVAEHVGISGPTCSPERMHADLGKAISECRVFAGVFPEDKFHLVQALQRNNHVVGMTGDGVNDAPALKQAEVGIAVANATAVAKAAASAVLTNPGLTDIVAAVETSRRIYQRMLTYTLNKIIKTIEVAFFLSLGVILTGDLIITPLLVVLLLFTNDFVTMSIATDRVSFATVPERWKIRRLVMTALPLAALILALSFSIFFTARNALHLPLPQLQTLVFITLVFGGQGTVYLVRERHHLWHSRPSHWMLISSAADIMVVSLLATHGILMAAVSTRLVAGVLLAVALYLIAVDFLKMRIFAYFDLH